MARSPRVVVITGASAGAGRAAALTFAGQGDRLGLIGRSSRGLDSAREEIIAAGGTAVAHAADVSDPEALARAADAIEAELGPIDVWVNNAMVTVLGPIAELKPEEVRRVMEVTFLGAAYGTMIALRRMQARGRGTIVQVGSALAYRSIPLQAPYCAAKAAIRAFTDSLRSELLHERSPIQITMVHMPGLNTPQFSWARNKFRRRQQPVPPIFQPEVAGRAVAFAADHPRREYWVGLSSVQAIMGQRVWPGLLDRMMSSKAWDGQFLDKEIAPDRPDNLFNPVEGLHATHGQFDDRAKPRSPQFWLERYRLMEVGAALLLSVLVAGIVGLLLWL
ncbi:MAG: SDR family oxidoreductase [Rhodospirillales bacterium]|nr:SDR family oxidoreductase [Rhodospirillales bacterium]